MHPLQGTIPEVYAGVRGRRNVEKIAAGLEASGLTIVQRPDPNIAPYPFTLRSESGEEHTIVCYAFTANEYRQRGRPEGEHRFQIKYGSDFKRYHDLYLDRQRRVVTLMFGVHHELDLFIAVDPEMHTPTWFSSSVEFKAADLEVARKTGWHGWERERSEGRRKLAKPMDDLRTEMLCAFVPERFAEYISFERFATGVDTGERLLLWDRMGRHTLVPSSSFRGARAIDHPLEHLLGLSAHEILDVVQDHFRLLVALRGSVAEHHLGVYLRELQGVSNVRNIDADGQPDFAISYAGHDIRIECKNTLRNCSRDGSPKVDFQKTRASKNDPCTRFYRPDQFEVLAACLHPVTESWDYRFCRTHDLTPHKSCADRLAPNVVVGGEPWFADLGDLLGVEYA